ncbi:MAG: hypothetical protein ACLFSX_07140, partial [Candidatus Acetothermia bacterium]
KDNVEAGSRNPSNAADDKLVDLDDLPVPEIVGLHKKGLTREDIGERLTGLSEREIKLAISHYYCNRREIENRLKQKDNLRTKFNERNQS